MWEARLDDASQPYEIAALFSLVVNVISCFATADYFAAQTLNQYIRNTSDCCDLTTNGLFTHHIYNECPYIQIL